MTAKNVRTLVLVAIALLLFGAAACGATYTDNFDRSNGSLSAGANWDVCSGSKASHNILSNVIRPPYADPIGDGAVIGDKYVGVLHTSQTYQRAAIDLKMPQVGLGGYRPQVSLNLNWNGAGDYYLSAHTYRITLRGTYDFCVQKLADDGTELFTSGWIAYPGGQLAAGTSYRLELIKSGNVITGGVKTAAGTMLGTASITDTGTQYTGGWVAVVDTYAGESVSGALWDNFEYQLETTAPSPGTVTGTVTSALTSHAISGAVVKPVCGSQSAQTSTSGTYFLVLPMAGVYTLEASAAGYLPTQNQVTVTLGGQVTKNFVLQVAPPVVTTQWDRSFYMQENEAKLFLTGANMPNSGVVVNCELKPVGGTVWQSRLVALNSSGNGTAVFDLRSLPVGDYVATASAQSGAQFDLATSKTLRKLAPKSGAVQYTSDGFLLRNGQPIFPVGVYYIFSYLHGDLLQEYADSKFNTQIAEWGSGQSYINWLNEEKPSGISPILGIQNSAEVSSIPYNASDQAGTLALWKTAAETLVQQVSTSTGGDGILAWYTWDEPPDGYWYTVTQTLHNVVQDKDPYHPSMVCLADPSLFVKYAADATDILGHDPYPCGGALSVVADRTDAAVAAAKGKPVIMTLQAFQDPGCPIPTPAELRCTAYLAVAHGTKGILWFSYDYGGQMATNHPDQWAAIKSLAGEMSVLGPAILTQPRSLSLVTKTGGSSIDMRLHFYQGAFYLIAVNRVNTAAAGVQFGFSGGISPFSVDVLFENRQGVVQNGAWTDDFAGYGVHVYKIAKQQQ